ncbi:MAG: DUF1232 domain-containing protein [Acidobacteriota bacterium]
MSPGNGAGKSSSALAKSKVSRADAFRFYDRIRVRISRYLAEKGPAAGSAGEFLMAAPDMFILLWRLANDPRVASKSKLLLGAGVAYFLSPLDLLPEFLFGPIGFLDDVVLGAFIVSRLLADVDPEIVREHWSGREDILAFVHRVMSSSDRLVNPRVLKGLKRFFD